MLCSSKSAPLPDDVYKNTAGQVANGVDPDQMLHSAASDLDLHRLPMSI